MVVAAFKLGRNCVDKGASLLKQSGAKCAAKSKRQASAAAAMALKSLDSSMIGALLPLPGIALTA